MDRTDEIVSLLAAVKRSGRVGGDILPVLASLAQEEAASRGFSDETLIYSHLSLFSGDSRFLPAAIELAGKINRQDLLTHLLRIARCFQDYSGRHSRPRPEHVDDRFLSRCREHGAIVLRQLQVGAGGRESCRSVFLVLDKDGLAKVFKELRPAEASRLGLIASEQEIYEHLGPVPGLPCYFGTTRIDDDLFFLRLAVCYGRTLDDLIDPNAPLAPEEAAYVVGCLARTLSGLHSARVVYNDLRPSNVKIDGDQVRLLDVGDAQFLPDGKEVTTYVHGPRYVAPEVVLRHKAQPASNVFQLGIVYHELLTGRHPFSDSLPHETDYELLRLRDCLANTMMTPRIDGENNLLARMLAADPSRRPSASEIAETLGAAGARSPRSQGRHSIPESNGTVLFPARIGIPHRGHVDFMARLLELGYDLVISLNASYVLTHMDPLPKWTVLKMIGRSLALRGLDTSRIRFFCTPLFDDDAQVGLHYALMPEVEKVVAVASGNPEVRRLFEDRWPIIDQRALFGSEGEEYETRSWGHRLREAVRCGDRVTFDELIAPGAEEIMSFEEMRSFGPESFLDFAWGRDRGRAMVVLRDSGKEVVRERVSTYSTPEDTLVRSVGAAFVDRFSRNSLIRSGSRNMVLTFESVTLEERNLSIHYRLEEQREDARDEDASLQRHVASS